MPKEYLNHLESYNHLLIWLSRSNLPATPPPAVIVHAI